MIPHAIVAMVTARLDLGSGHVLVVDGEQILHDGEPTTPRELTRRYPADGKVWAWLREHGIRRVSTTSGPSGRTKHRKQRLLSLSPEHSERLDELAARLGCTISSAAEQAIDTLDQATSKRTAK
ncbi:MAG: hypothetical protein KF850_33130 [Labilithrix sp.]|nr:hypothetical protein [Labilithrix sp.]MBX3216923.1 hypothetical protein [Labilithrix sp.]